VGIDMKKIILYIATSLDGFIAREDGSLDWLPGSEAKANHEPKESVDSVDTNEKKDYGYSALMDSIDTTLMGNKTYDQVLTFGPWPYTAKKCIVFTHEKNPQPDKNVIFVNDPVSFTKELKNKEGKDIWLIGGSEINSLLLNAGLIDTIILTVIPTIIGKGIPLFQGINKDIQLRLTKVEHFKSGLAQLSYDF
jgi:dihydrofolate reductase